MKELSTKDIDNLLERMPWPDGLEATTRYMRTHDDHDGTHDGKVVVVISHDGDAWVDVQGKRPCETLRYRTYQGGGRSFRVRNALLILAYAIMMDNKDNPEKI